MACLYSMHALQLGKNLPRIPRMMKATTWSYCFNPNASKRLLSGLPPLILEVRELQDDAELVGLDDQQ